DQQRPARMHARRPASERWYLDEQTRPVTTHPPSDARGAHGTVLWPAHRGLCPGGTMTALHSASSPCARAVDSISTRWTLFPSALVRFGKKSPKAFTSRM